MAFVQKGTALANGTAGTSNSVSIAGVAANNLLVLTRHHGSTSATIGINTPTGWALTKLGPSVTVGGYTVQSGIFHIQGATAGANSATLTTTNSSTAYAVISEYSGYPTSGSLDQVGSASTTGATSLTGNTTGATAQANELVVVATVTDDSTGVANNGGTTPTTGYNSLLSKTNTITDDAGQHAYKEVTSTGVQSATQAVTTSSYMSMSLATFEAASGGGSTTTVAPGKGAVVLTGHQPGIAQTITTTIAPGKGAIVLAGHQPGITEGIAPGKGHVTVTGYQPTVSQTITTTVAPIVGHLTLSGHAPAITLLTNIQPSVGHITLGGHAPGVVETFLPGAGHITLSGYAPTINQTITTTINPSTGHLILAGHVPTFGGATTVDWLQRARHRHRRM